jgi:hypothetical protein
VFAFAPATGAERLLTQIQKISTRMFVSPTFASGDVILGVSKPPAKGSLGVYGGAQSGLPLHLAFTAPTATQEQVEILAETGSTAARFALDDSAFITVRSTPIAKPAGAWSTVSAFKTAWIEPLKVSRDSMKAAFAVTMRVGSRPGNVPMRYQVDIESSGRPGWLEEYNASGQGEPFATFGLSTLFAQLNYASTPLARFYVSVY